MASNPANDIHQTFMRHALELAVSRLGQAWPNPAVGAVIVRDDEIVAVGATGKGGRPHAESVAIAAAGDAARGATMYVTLEPCAHHGQTPPCVDAIIQSGIAKIHIACRDPDPRVAGKGIEKLKAAGLEVYEGLEREAAERLNEGFFSRIQRHLPWVMVKLATSLDGKMALASGESRWITGEAAREFGHRLRAGSDAIATGIGTVLGDNPELTCRVEGLEDRSPVRIIFDRKLQTPLESKLVKTAHQTPVWLMTGRAVLLVSALEEKRRALEAAGVTLLTLENAGMEESADALKHAVQTLAEKGITRLLVEAGPILTTCLLHAGLIDELFWFRSPTIIGGDGLSAIGDLGVDSLTSLSAWQSMQTLMLGADRVEIYRRN